MQGMGEFDQVWEVWELHWAYKAGSNYDHVIKIELNLAHV